MVYNFYTTLKYCILQDFWGGKRFKAFIVLKYCYALQFIMPVKCSFIANAIGSHNCRAGNI